MKVKAPLALLLLLSLVVPALAQTIPATPPEPQKTTDDKDDVVRITTNLVQVDAVVTKDGKPVTNLTANDFEIYQDGKKQTITSFAYVSNLPATTSQPAPPVRGKGNDVAPFRRVDPNEPHRTIAFVVDDLGLSFESMGQVRRQLRKYIAEELQPNDLVAIIRTGGWVGALQQFTNDRRVLNRAVDQMRWSPCSRVGLFLFRPGEIQQNDSGSACSQNSVNNTLRSMRFILDAMGELPGRKSLVMMSDSVPIESQDWGFMSGSRSEPDFGSQTDPAFGSTNYAGLLRRLAEKAIRNSVVIYSVDTQGLVYTGMTAADALPPPSDTFRGGVRDTITHMNSLMASRSELLWRRREGGEMIARQTGGFQIRNSNSFHLDRIVEDQAGYYLIGYRPSDETFNKRFHHIKAKVKPSGMTIRTRFGFLGVSEEDVNKEQRSARDLTNLALASPFRAQDINVDLSSFFVNDKRAGSMVRSFVYIDAKDVQFTAQNDRQLASIELHTMIFGDNGVVVDQSTRSASLDLSQSDYDYAVRNGMQLSFDIRVKRPGAYQVRIAVRDRGSSRIGSAGQFVSVADLTKKKLAMSGIVLGTGRDSNGQALANPGARRFVVNSELHFAYALYNAVDNKGAPRNLVMQARIFRDGKNVYSGPQTPVSGIDKGDASRVVVSGSMGLPPDLGPGTYYLQVLITDADPNSKAAPVVEWIEFDLEQ